MKFWSKTSRFVLKQQIGILITIAIITALLASQMKYMRLSYTEANLLPKDHIENVKYDQFLEVFGEEGTLIVLGVKDSNIFKPETFLQWNQLANKLDSLSEIEYSISIGDLKELVKNKDEKRFELKELSIDDLDTKAKVDRLKKHLFNELPFYDNLLFNKETHTIQTALFIDKDIVNTKKRKEFIFERFIPIISQFEKETNIDVHVSGMPYIRSMNSENIKSEMGKFVGLALAVTAFIFFLFFRSFRATFITLLVVSIGVIWAFGFIGLFRFEITVLTALIPPLIIVIGVPNAIFIINKYQQEIKKHSNKTKSLHRVISKVGNATLMTNITTAAGFATFIFTNSSLLREFGIIASINIMAIFVLSILIIPSIYSFMPLPKKKHLKHLDQKWISRIVDWMVFMVRNKKNAIYIVSFVVVITSIIGVYKIKVSGSLLDDMPKSKVFYKDIVFFEEEFGGIMPLEIMIDTKKDKGVFKLSTLKKIDKLTALIDEMPGLSRATSVVDLVKYSKQAFYNGNPKYYQLPTSQEKAFLLDYINNSNQSSGTGALINNVDSKARYARITTYMQDVGTEEMAQIQTDIQAFLDKEFDTKKFDVTLTGKALVFLKGTNYLIKNLIVSLGLAILLISIFMGYMFKSLRMIFISLIPNLLPLLVTGGIMGYLGIPIKPSTILVFSIAFGISVDDTIHFLAKYRQELIASNWKIRKSVYKAIRETGVSMFYTSIVLFFGFLVFLVSSFGGTKALGGLVSITLLFAMVSNLLLLPALLLSLERKITKKKKIR
ncbi:efflux RND transporter permease subunit [Flavicella sp.]|uniref:efflux RND transporter permease subunit n=1 Tax=Flavicella sp. TaxID=2957742 RepID=UPI00262D8EBA|nr:efflux RND transporter permease subunit [Flavicella sp.]MDG1804602.1 efflux RND transporter permease subunit [Flavicella sp.]